jgi:flavin reductase (DIM6/NTAB) family NADH-FMN oxidoreductase RutF
MDTREFKTDIFNIFDERWALVTAGTPDDFNAMTISWGSMGTIWGPPGNGRPIVTIYVNPKRYTYGYLNNNDRFEVSFFPEKYRDDLLIMGTKSGRDGDKLTETHLTPVTEDGIITYKEAEMTFVCRKLYQQTLDKSLIRGGIGGQFYAPDEEAHRMYIGEVEDIIKP